MSAQIATYREPKWIAQVRERPGKVECATYAAFGAPLPVEPPQMSMHELMRAYTQPRVKCGDRDSWRLWD